MIEMTEGEAENQSWNRKEDRRQEKGRRERTRGYRGYKRIEQSKVEQCRAV